MGLVLLAFPTAPSPIVANKIVQYAQEYNVSVLKMADVVACESNGSTTVQSGYFQNGKQENSWGLVQINLDWNPSVTKAEALDTDFSLNFLASRLSTGQGKLWSCYRKQE